MSFWRGRLTRGIPGLGGWRLRGDDGKRYVLMGSIPDRLEGHRVKVRGELTGVPLKRMIRVEEVKPLQGTLGDP